MALKYSVMALYYAIVEELVNHSISPLATKIELFKYYIYYWAIKKVSLWQVPHGYVVFSLNLKKCHNTFFPNLLLQVEHDIALNLFLTNLK